MDSSNPFDGAFVSVDQTKKVMLREFSDSQSVIEQDDLIFQEVFDTSDVSLCQDGLEEQLVTSNFTSDQEKGVDSKEAIFFKDEFSVPLNANKKRGIRKSASFSCSADLKYATGSVLLSSEGKENECYSALGNSVYISSTSLSLDLHCITILVLKGSSNYQTLNIWPDSTIQATAELISAIKGTRAQNGICPNVKLHVKWTSDVYDPPSSSMSHTVKKNHHQRSKAKKKNISKSKRNKGKSSWMHPEKSCK